MTWAQAQSFCRAEHTDLATVDSNNEFNQVVTAAQKYYNNVVWIGLYDDINSWRWSLQRDGFYGVGETTFWMWNSGEPNNFGGIEDCVEMNGNGAWNDCPCRNMYYFVCYNVDSSNYVFVPDLKNFSDAQSYCRQFYTDLVSVRNINELGMIQRMGQNQDIWIGLYRDSWKWSDGSPTSNWKPSIGSVPVSYIYTPCMGLSQGQLNARACGDKLFFVCYDEIVTQQIVRVKVTQNSSPVDLEDAKEAVLQQLVQMLKDGGLSQDIKVTWRKQSDGKTFYLEQT
ncbi:hypothetical protein Q5P01_016700 [Channa striata]|uniref:C-type lectin domain-containing protein n=1 Tax=Channa striata TaxID=64152 RepID=A0AA88MC09_CHASR|nr:hypothetical protein Q5P01_016700 [Channa striata]